MAKTSPSLIEKSRNLRKRGFTLGEIVKKTGVPKTTVYDHVYDIPLSPILKEKIKRIQKENARRLAEFVIRERKGKCIPGRVVPKPKAWSPDLISLTAHFIFDGKAQSHSCVYSNRNEVLIKQVKCLMEKIFNLHPIYYLNQETGVSRISYHYVELADCMRKKIKELKQRIPTSPLGEKRLFLKAFFDDEGNVNIHKNKRRVRGYQHNLEILRLVQKLLKDFDIESRIDKKYKEIVITRKENLIKFRNKINFSKGIYINPNRKNSIWKQKLEKREILKKAINSYKS